MINYQRAVIHTSGYGFYAVISAIPSSEKNYEKDTYDSNYDPKNGYKNNIAILHNFTVLESSNTKISIDTLDIEAGCDELKLVAENTSTMVLQEQTIVRVDSRVPKFTLEFDSDGNNRQAGFIYKTDRISCEKSSTTTITVPCNGDTIRQGRPQGYCTGEKNTYTIYMNESCTYLQFNIVIRCRLIPNIGDLVEVYTHSGMNYSNNGSLNIINTIRVSGVYPVTIKFQSGTPSNPFEVTQDGSWEFSVNAYNGKFKPKTKNNYLNNYQNTLALFQ